MLSTMARRTDSSQSSLNSPRTRTAAKTAFIVVAASSLAFGVASCSSSSDAPPPPPSSSASPSVSGLPLVFDVTVSPTVTRDASVGDGESQTVGVEVMEGSTTVNEYSVRAKLMYTMDYTNGEGPITGFLTLTWSDGTAIAMRLEDGKGTADAESGNTTGLTANLKVINGSKKAAGVSGQGTVEGSKASSSSSSSSLKLNIDLSLVGAPNDYIGDGVSESPSASASGSGSSSSSSSSSSSASSTVTIAP